MFKTISKSPTNPSPPIIPSPSKETGIKITYDSTGKILSSTFLRSTDIPDLSISQVTGLQEELDTLALISDLPAGIQNDILYYNNSEWAGGNYTTIRSILQLGTAAYFNYENFLTSEADPLFQASPAGSITQVDIDNWNAGSLGGTVTSFSAGDLSPLFTTSEATATTTPALSFSLSNAGANTYFGNATGSPASPSYTSAAALTKVDDTNVTLTLGGSPTTSLLNATSLTLGWTGTLADSRLSTTAVTPGTYNLATITVSSTGRITSASDGDAELISLAGLGVTQGDTIYASGANTYSKLAKDTNATRYLANTGTSNNPAWAQVNLANGVTGDLPFSNLTQIAGLSVLGVTGSSTADVAAITAGSDFQVLRRSGSAIAFGSIDLSQANATTNQLPVSKGGTGASTFTNDRLLTGNGTSAIVGEANLTFDGTTLNLSGRAVVAATGSYSADTNFLYVASTATTTANNVDIYGLNSLITAANDGTPTGNSFRGAHYALSTNTTTAGILYGMTMAGTNTSPNVSQLYGMSARLDENSASGSLTNRYGMDFLLVKGAQDATDAHTGFGLRARIQDSTSTGRWSSGTGASITVENCATNVGIALTTQNTKGATGTMYGITITSTASGASTVVDNAYGIRFIPTEASSGTITNYYSLFNNTTPVAGTSYFLYNSADYRNYLNGNLALGVDVTTAKLFVRGTGTTSSTYSIFAENSSGTDYFKLNDAGQLYLGSSTPNAAAILQADSTTMGFLPPRMTTTQRDAISTPPAGLVIYNTTTNKLNVYTTAWEAITSA